MEQLTKNKKYKFYILFKGGQKLVFETNTDIRTEKRQFINGGIFVCTENKYTINLAQVEGIKVEVLH